MPKSRSKRGRTFLASSFPREFGAAGYISLVVGVILVLLVIFIVGPIGLFVVGGMWSALTGWLLSADADARAADKPS